MSFVPAHYDLTLAPDSKALTFFGTVEVTGQARHPGDHIVLNAGGLDLDQVRLDGIPAAGVTYDKKLGRANLRFAKPYRSGPHRLAISYHGPITRGTFGFFAMDYAGTSGPQRTLATNLEPAGARQVLPCWDEPGIKASFSVTVEAPGDQTVISNMPVAQKTPLADGRQRVRFLPSPRMATYLLFVGIGDFERVHRVVDGVDMGVVVKRGDTPKARYALGEACSLLHYYNTYFGVRYPLPKLDLVAAPGDIDGGSMENWGAIFYSQEHLLFDPATSTEGERQLVFQVVSHEMAHQWFGDLVTMAWWDNLWLNEGFARWMQTHAADALHPEWKTGLQAAEVFERGKRSDAKPSTHPVLQAIASAEQASQVFDSITYDKGAAVITMMEAFVGSDAFREGVRRYMKAHRYGNTVDRDLWREIAGVSPKPVMEIERDFTRQVGLPLIRVRDSGQSTVLTEDRFVEDPDRVIDTKRSGWKIPLDIQTAGRSRRQLFLKSPLTIGDTAPLVNVGGTAYARVLYTPNVFTKLVKRLASLSAADQINLLNDAWALGQCGYSPARNVMEIIAKLPAEANAVVWERAVALLLEIDRALRNDPERPMFRQRAKALLARVIADSHRGSNGSVLRSLVWEAQAHFGDQSAIDRAKVIFASNKGSVVDLRTALTIVGDSADEATFSTLLDRGRSEKDPQVKSRLLQALAGASNPDFVPQIVELAVGPVPPAGTGGYLLFAAARNNPDAVWKALRPYLVKGRLPFDRGIRWAVIPLVAGLSTVESRVTELRTYADLDMPTDAREPINEAFAAIRLNERIRRFVVPDIRRWLTATGE